MAESARSLFETLSSRRTAVLQRARENAKLTIPSLMPPAGNSQFTRLTEPYQGLGAKGTMSLTSRLLMALLPAGAPFFRFQLPADVRMQTTQGETDPEIERDLALSEELVTSEIERRGWRTATGMSLQQLIVAGNVLEQMRPDNTIRVFRLDQYVVARDPSGKPIMAVIKEALHPDAVPEEARGLVVQSGVRPRFGGPDNTIDLYTVIEWNQKAEEYKVRQELNDNLVPGSDGRFKDGELPYFFLGWSFIPGEDYARSKIEEHIGDLRSLEGVEKAWLETVAAAARNVIMVKPNAAGGNLRRRLARAKNLDVISGDFDQVSFLGFDTLRQITSIKDYAQELRVSLAGAFLLGSASTRDAERVTAEEIRRNIEELEAVLGGIFSTLSTDMMSQRLNRLIIQMQRQIKLPAWDEGDVDPVILTGVQALSRERDVGRVAQAAQLVQTFGPEALDYIPMGSLLQRAMVGLGLPSDVRSDDEVAQLRARRAEQAALQQGVGAAIPQVTKAAANQATKQ